MASRAPGPQRPSDDDGAGLLQRFVGQQLSSVAFVQDYLQLDVDGPRLTCFAWPVVIDAGTTRPGWRVGEPGYRDALCTLIARHVAQVEVTAASGIRLAFTDTDLHTGTDLVLAPAPEDVTGPEIAMLSGFADQAWMVWRTGGPPFAHL